MNCQGKRGYENQSPAYNFHVHSLLPAAGLIQYPQPLASGSPLAWFFDGCADPRLAAVAVAQTVSIIVLIGVQWGFCYRRTR